MVILALAMKISKYPLGLTITSVKHIPLYQKAVDIYKLSQDINHKAGQRKSLSELYRSSNLSEQALENLVVNAIGLPSKIAIAQTTRSPKLRLESIDSIKNHIEHLRTYCKQLTANYQPVRPYLRKLSKELASFRKMQVQWSVLLTQQN